MDSKVVLVTIVGARIACTEGVRDDWRTTAQWAERWLHDRFGDSVKVTYHDLFDPDCPPLPTEAKLPLVLVAGEVVSSGGKLPRPLIPKRIESLLGPSP